MTEILIAGVGGQGTLLASKVLGRYAVLTGCDVKLSEVHGMAQRGGSVVTYVRMGEQVFSPLIEPGCADAVLAFEQLEALRYAHYLKKGGVLLMSTQKLMPVPVLSGLAAYPEDIEGALKERGVKLISLPAASLAAQAGSVRAANIVMTGALSATLGFDLQIMEKAVCESVAEKFAAVNLSAFRLGAAIG